MSLTVQRLTWSLGAIGALSVLVLGGNLTMAEPAAGKPLVHNVYFKLKDSTPANVAKLGEACHKYLSNHDGTLYFGAGPVVEEFNRPVNQKDFDICLCVVFKDKAAHDVYQTHPRHLQFIEENKATWDVVRVFDSWGK